MQSNPYGLGRAEFAIWKLIESIQECSSMDEHLLGNQSIPFFFHRHPGEIRVVDGKIELWFKGQQLEPLETEEQLLNNLQQLERLTSVQSH